MTSRGARRATSAVTLLISAAAAKLGIGTPASARTDEAKEQGASRDALFFRGDVAGASTHTDPYRANARSQDTLTLGRTAWF